MLTEKESDRLLTSWNDTAADYSQDKCIHQLFESQAKRTPDFVRDRSYYACPTFLGATPPTSRYAHGKSLEVLQRTVFTSLKVEK